jgi:type II secretory pathway predicted ATPase ExeA
MSGTKRPRNNKPGDRKSRFGKYSSAERLQLVEKVFVKYPRLKEIRERIDFCRTRSKAAAEVECMLIAGDSGAGKTTLIKWYAGAYPVRVLPDRRIQPVLVVVVPSPATVKGLATEMLKVLGDPAADRGTISSQTLRLRKFIAACEVELIILDEFQHFDDRQSRNVLKTISDWLKNLVNQCIVPIVLVGMPGCESVLDQKGNEQLKRRFASRHEILPFAWDTTEGVNEFRQLLKSIDDALPLMKDSHLADLKTAFLIYAATNGIIDYVMELLRWAAALAIECGLEQIDRELLARAYEDRIAQTFPTRPNPFNAKIEKNKQAAKRVSRPSNGTNKRVKSRKLRRSMSDVLSQS